MRPKPPPLSKIRLPCRINFEIADTHNVVHANMSCRVARPYGSLEYTDFWWESLDGKCRGQNPNSWSPLLIYLNGLGFIGLRAERT